MKNVIGMLIIVMFVSAVLRAAERPPELGPVDVPFVYDPNLCTAPVLSWLVIEPNISSIFRVSAHNRWGKRIDLTVTDAHDPNIYVLIDQNPMTGGPFNGYDQNWQCMITPAVEGVHYLELTATDMRGRTDRRTLLMLCAADEPPFLFMRKSVV